MKVACSSSSRCSPTRSEYARSGSVSVALGPKTLCIRDTGIGIAPEDLPRVFEKGFTGCNGRTDKRATGIGLYLCRRILEKLGAQSPSHQRSA